MTKRSARLWDAVAGLYDFVFVPLDVILRRWRRRAAAEIPAWPVLEAGTGTGLNFRYFPRNACGVATDVSYGMLRRAARRHDRPCGMYLVVADVERLPFRDGAFVSALATLVFCGVDSPNDGLREIRRTLAPSGRIVLLEHVRPRGILGPLFDLINLFPAKWFCEHLNRRTAQTVATWFDITELRETAYGALQLIVSRR